jgi:serine/threonine protein kinase
MEKPLEQPKPLRAGDPEHVGSYRLVGLLGEGGQGTVYRGEAADGRHVAVKVLHARFTGDTKARSRFAAELAHAKRVAPFCTAQVLDSDVEGELPYIVSEFVEGRSLSQMIASGTVPDGPALQRLAIATVTALAAIHEAGIVHRDFKPSNVIMGADGPRVIDFGIARALDATGTLSSAIVGTPAYMAPEQIHGGTIGPAADIFAWGCTIAYASSGATLFGQDSIPSVMHRILHEDPDLRQLTGPLRDIVTACLAKEPPQRPTARQVLLRLLGGTETDEAADTLLTEGALASTAQVPAPQPPVDRPPVPPFARPPEPAAPGPQAAMPYGQPDPHRQHDPHRQPDPYGRDGRQGQQQVPQVPPHGPEPAAHPAPWAQAAPTVPHGATARGGSRMAHRVMALTVAGAAVLLCVTTLLPWAEVWTVRGTSDVPTDIANVAGVATIWGIFAMVMAVVAAAVAIISVFTRRCPTAWAAVPGGVAISLIAVFLIRLQDVRHQHPYFGKLTDADLRGLDMAIRVSLSTGCYAALALAVAVVALALISLGFAAGAISRHSAATAR